jgi:hypothetical protein
MIIPEPRPSVRSVLGPTFVVLLAGLLGFALFGTLPIVEGIGVALVGLGAAAGVRMSRSPGVRAWAPVGPLLALGILAVAASPAAIPALYGGATALAFLLWVSDDPNRLPGGPQRAAGRLLLPAIGLAIAWSSSFLLPRGVGSIGIAAALLAAVIVLVALLLRAPEFIARDASASS